MSVQRREIPHSGIDSITKDSLSYWLINMQADGKIDRLDAQIFRARAEQLDIGIKMLAKVTRQHISMIRRRLKKHASLIE